MSIELLEILLKDCGVELFNGCLWFKDHSDGLFGMPMVEGATPKILGEREKEAKVRSVAITLPKNFNGTSLAPGGVSFEPLHILFFFLQSKKGLIFFLSFRGRKLIPS